MELTRIFREQHLEILHLTGGLTATLDMDRLGEDPEPAHAAMLHLARTLRVHLDLEDRDLYPRLLRHPDSQVKALAQEYQSEMGRIHGDFEAFAARWHSPELIQPAPWEYATELLSVLEILHLRIHREDGELYPLLEGLA